MKRNGHGYADKFGCHLKEHITIDGENRQVLGLMQVKILTSLDVSMLRG